MDDISIKNITKEDFNKAFFKSQIERILSKIFKSNDSLLSFREIVSYIKINNQYYKGMQEVEINNILGSEDRYRDFDKKFLPKRQELRGRWESIDAAHYKDIILPPIQLYQIGNIYFVRDGNHRVSVAKLQGREFIDAEVIELKTNIEVNANTTIEDLKNIVIEEERKSFLDVTKLDEYRDTSILRFSFIGKFDQVYSHIEVHKYFLGIENNRDFTFLEAMLSWYDRFFIPIIDEIKNEKLIKLFPDMTVADLYVLTIKYWDDLKTETGDDIEISDAVKSYKNQYKKENKKDFFGFFKNKCEEKKEKDKKD